jgi:hypothetical protein
MNKRSKATDKTILNQNFKAQSSNEIQSPNNKAELVIARKVF